jgi:CRISPR/Cas system CSM-associated protein Csm2 small subunit
MAFQNNKASWYKITLLAKLHKIALKYAKQKKYESIEGYYDRLLWLRCCKKLWQK